MGPPARSAPPTDSARDGFRHLGNFFRWGVTWCDHFFPAANQRARVIYSRAGEGDQSGPAPRALATPRGARPVAMATGGGAEAAMLASSPRPRRDRGPGPGPGS
ncbi:unnamed protein product [Coccothraustes coccothraustes]